MYKVSSCGNYTGLREFSLSCRKKQDGYKKADKFIKYTILFKSLMACKHGKEAMASLACKQKKIKKNASGIKNEIT